MGPKRRGGHPVGRASRPAASGDEAASPEEGTTANQHEDFEAFVRATLTQLLNGQRQLEEQLGASIEYNSERITELEKAKDILEDTVD